MITAIPLPEGSRLPLIKPFHVTFSYHHSRFGDGIAIMNKGFSDFQFVSDEIAELEAWEADNEPRPRFHTFLEGRLKDAELEIQRGLEIYRTAIFNLNQWGSGEGGVFISRNFPYQNPEGIDHY